MQPLYPVDLFVDTLAAAVGSYGAENARAPWQLWESYDRKSSALLKEWTAWWRSRAENMSKDEYCRALSYILDEVAPLYMESRKWVFTDCALLQVWAFAYMALAKRAGLPGILPEPYEFDEFVELRERVNNLSLKE